MEPAERAGSRPPLPADADETVRGEVEAVRHREGGGAAVGDAEAERAPCVVPAEAAAPGERPYVDGGATTYAPGARGEETPT